VTNWKNELARAARSTKANVSGISCIQDVQHAILVSTALAAFGDDPRATFYIEGIPPAGNIPRPDLILLHPAVGVLVIENKGIELGDIHRIHETCLTLTRNGILKDEDPIHQAERVMFRLRDLCKQRFDLQHALFLRTIAFPRIRRGEFEMRFKTHFPPETLFADACTNAETFRKQVLAYANTGQQTALKTNRLTQRAHDQIMTVLSRKALFYAPRRTFLEDADPNLLGSQVQEMELALKEPTQQQKEHGKADLRGAHRLFRGVAGSGKSIMLALSASQTLLDFNREHTDLFGPQPQRRVLVVCFNKALVHYLKNKIDDRYGRIAWDAPGDDALTVTHFEGLVRELESREPALATGLTWQDDKEERAKALCSAWDHLDASARDPLLFDAVYIDEAQDFQPAEFQLFARLARIENGKQTLIIFYDNAQNIYGITPPTWADLGINIIGRTVFLDQCLRNTAETLAFAFNVLVGSFAPAGQRVATRQFADVASLKERKLISENGDRYEIHFSPRNGPHPVVCPYPNRNAEIAGTASAIRALIETQMVLPSDILILYKSHHSFKTLAEKLQTMLGNGCQLRQVDAIHNVNKSLPLIEDGFLTLSTIASAKGYDAPVVFLLGADELATDPQGRASFYVGATRAKLTLCVSGVKQVRPTLLDEILLASKSTAREPKTTAPPPAGPVAKNPTPIPDSTTIRHKCRHCGSENLHAQHGRYGYFFRCIACTENTPIDTTCPRCGEKGRVRKAGHAFYLECEKSQYSAIIHTNVPLSDLEK
jgi:superfamily I DNA and RNA helicase